MRVTKQVTKANRPAARAAANGVPVHRIAGGLNLTYNGIQSMPGYADQFVFTDNDTKSTFQTSVLISIAELERKAWRLRARFSGVNGR